MSLKLSQKIPFVITFAAVASGGLAASVSIYQATDALRRTEENGFSALVESKKSALQTYLTSIQEDIISLSNNSEVVNALEDFSRGWDEIGEDQTEYLHRWYIENNPNPAGKKENLDAANDGSSYSVFHRKYHGWLRNFLRQKGYYDIFLFRPDGTLVYTVFKERDFATNLVDGQWKDTDLGKVFSAASGAKPGEVFFYDFRPYAPSNDVPASFISTPIYDHAGTYRGVLAFQMPIARINSTMDDYKGLGETGETFIVGQDHLMRNDSRFRPEGETSILKTKVDNPEVDLALAGKSGYGESVNSRGNETYAAYSPLDFNGTRWAIIGEIQQDEADIPIVKLRNNLLMIVAGSILAVTLIGIFFSQTITRAISRITKAMRKVADGDLSTEVPNLGRKDEIGEMAAALQVFKENGEAMERMRKNEELQKKAAEEQKRAAMRDLAAKFEQNVKGVVDMVASAATEMDATSQSVTTVAETNKGKLEILSSQIAGTTRNVQMVSSATTQLSSAINEISGQVSRATTITSAAVEEARRTDVTVHGLTDASQKIGEVLEMINSIAAQINLLALNATIEAARAGEAGKGFAVVASEVKNLASQTTKATEQIAAYISSIQGATGDTVSAINSISAKIRDINSIASTIAAAVEQQGAATRDIANNVHQAAASTEEVSRNATEVSASSAQTGEAAHEMNAATNELSRQAEILRREVDNFLVGIRQG